MRYFVRAVKYFIYFSLIFALIILVLVLLGLAGQDQGGILRDGWKSVGQIAFLFGAVAAVFILVAAIRLITGIVKTVSGNGKG